MLDAEDDAADAVATLTKLKNKHARGRASKQDVDAAAAAKSAAQAALAVARQLQRDVRDALLAYDGAKFPEARYYADHAGIPPVEGLQLLHESGLLVDRNADDDYEVSRGTVARARTPRLTALVWHSGCRRSRAVLTRCCTLALEMSRKRSRSYRCRSCARFNERCDTCATRRRLGVTWVFHR